MDIKKIKDIENPEWLKKMNAENNQALQLQQTGVIISSGYKQEK